MSAAEDAQGACVEAPSPSKRAKTDGGLFRHDLFDDSSRQGLRNSFVTSEPYTHLVIRDLCQRDVLAAARDELIHNVDAKFKETDLFKVYQTGDLANMDGLEPEMAAKLPTLLKIRNAIYSDQFRSFVEEITGLAPGTLTQQTDCSSNVYAHGGHLLCHDDVISTRAVSYIIYLTDPDEEWQPEDGGALELYAVRDDALCHPDVVPSACLLPHFNSMAMFTVQPGRSFHAVQEVYTDAKPRLSISGWYHAAAPPVGAEQASLNQLKSGRDDAAFEPLTHSVDSDECNDEEKALLAEWLNPTYLDRKTHRAMLTRWEADSCVQLRSFLRDDKARLISEACQAADSRDRLGNGQVPDYRAGEGGGWALVGPCHKRRLLRFDGDAAARADDGAGACSGSGRCEAGAALHGCLQDFLKSSAFAKWLLRVTDLGVRAARAEVRRFRPGLDYTIAHFGVLSDTPQLDVTLCFVDDASEENRAAWGSDDLGGFQCYMLADEEANAAAETYRADAEDDDALISCSASSNTLNVILRDKGLMKFVKFVSHDAPSSRWDVAVEFTTDLRDDEIDGGSD